MVKTTASTKCFITEIACVRFFTSVNSQVFDQIMFLIESFPTSHAKIRAPLMLSFHVKYRNSTDLYECLETTTLNGSKNKQYPTALTPSATCSVSCSNNPFLSTSFSNFRVIEVMCLQKQFHCSNSL